MGRFAARVEPIDFVCELTRAPEGRGRVEVLGGSDQVVISDRQDVRPAVEAEHLVESSIAAEIELAMLDAEIEKLEAREAKLLDEARAAGLYCEE